MILNIYIYFYYKRLYSEIVDHKKTIVYFVSVIIKKTTDTSWNISKNNSKDIFIWKINYFSVYDNTNENNHFSQSLNKSIDHTRTKHYESSDLKKDPKTISYKKFTFYPTKTNALSNINKPPTHLRAHSPTGTGTENPNRNRTGHSRDTNPTKTNKPNIRWRTRPLSVRNRRALAWRLHPLATDSSEGSGAQQVNQDVSCWGDLSVPLSGWLSNYRLLR